METLGKHQLLRVSKKNPQIKVRSIQKRGRKKMRKVVQSENSEKEEVVSLRIVFYLQTKKIGTKTKWAWGMGK